MTFYSWQGLGTMEVTLRKIIASSEFPFSQLPSQCGRTSPLTYSDIVLKLTNNLLYEAKEAGANAIAVCCPLCQANLNGRQQQIEE